MHRNEIKKKSHANAAASSVRAPGRVCSVCCVALCKACAAGSDTWPKAGVDETCGLDVIVAVSM